jgi:peptidoglycan hydrolase-like protein with peptidoglycan-binding domain
MESSQVLGHEMLSELAHVTDEIYRVGWFRNSATRWWIMANMRNARSRTGRIFILVAVLALVAAACGGGDDAGTTTTLATVVTTPPATTAPVTTSAPATTTTTTVPGSDIPATATMLVVQGDLTFLEFYEGPIDGIAGDETEAAISAFQKDAGIEVDGAYGPQTDDAMAETLESNEEYVIGLQEFLMELKLYPGPADGDYGQGTQNAVKLFQKDCEVEETGLLDIATRLCLADL